MDKLIHDINKDLDIHTELTINSSTVKKRPIFACRALYFQSMANITRIVAKYVHNGKVFGTDFRYDTSLLINKWEQHDSNSFVSCVYIRCYVGRTEPRNLKQSENS